MASRDVVVLNEQASRLEVAQVGDTYNLPADANVQGKVSVSGDMSANSVSVGGNNANAGEVACTALRLPGGTVTAPGGVTPQSLSNALTNGASADLAVLNQPAFELTSNGRQLFTVDQQKGLAGMLGNIANPLTKLPLSRAEEITGTAAAAGAQFSGAPTYTRASTGTYIDPLDGLVKTAAIDTPRFERMADGGIGLLLEGSSTNLLLDSGNMVGNGDGGATTSWLDNAANSTTSGGISDPMGGTAGANWPADAAGNIWCLQTVDTGAAVTGKTFTFSVWLKAGTTPATNVKIYLDDGAAPTESGSASATVLTTLPTGWTRYSVTYTFATSTRTTVRAHVFAGAQSAGQSFDVWGAQLEALPFASSYIPTTATAVTRAADVLELPVAGNLPWANGSRSMSIMMDADALGDTGSALWQRLLTTDQSLYIRRGNTDAGLTAFVGTATLYATTPSIVDGVAHRIGLIADATTGTATSWFDGVQVASAVMGVSAMPVESRLIVGSGISGNQSWFGHVRNFRIYDRALTDAEIAAA